MPTEMPITDPIRKAAILVSALDRNSADALLDKMGPDQAARVRHAVFELDDITDQEQDQVMREFVAAGGGQVGPPTRKAFEANSAPPFDQAALHAGRQHPATAPGRQADRHDDHARADDGPFPILREASIETLANHLAHENGQVIAVVVAHLPPRRAAELIGRMAPHRQADVLRRVAAMDAASPAAIEVLQQQFEAKLTEELRQQRNRTAGIAAVNLILSAAGSQRDELLNNLTANDNELSQMVRSQSTPGPSPHATLPQKSLRDGDQHRDGPRTSSNHRPNETADHSPDPRPARETCPAEPKRTQTADGTPDARTPDAHTPDARTPGERAKVEHATSSLPVERAGRTERVTFEQLGELDDQGLAVLFSEIDPEITLLALAGASPEFVQRMMRPLLPREARTLRRKMERLGPIRLSDIAAAQREVAKMATQLVEEGVLSPPAPARFAVAA